MRRMICDVPNLFFRGVAANKAALTMMTDEEACGYALHICLMSLRKHYNNIRPQELAIVFEGRNNWRKQYTKSDDCYSGRVYKANRVKDPEMEVLFNVMQVFKEFCKTQTSLVVIEADELEGDDCISAYVQHHKDDEIVILSGDKDFVQLLKFDNVILINPDNASRRTVESVCGVDDAEYFMFEKCFRGDSGDNVISAYPRIRAAKLQQAWGVSGQPDIILLNKLLDYSWELPSSEEGGGTKTMNVGKLYEENNLLMNLTAQPERIQELMKTAISDAYANKAKYNHFQVLKFLGKNKLEKIAETIDSFVPMLSNTGYTGILTEGTEINEFGATRDVKIKGITF
jgi:5'-3' exonuclease, N-terminal resolvase-like domain